MLCILSRVKNFIKLPLLPHVIPTDKTNNIGAQQESNAKLEPIASWNIMQPSKMASMIIQRGSETIIDKQCKMTQAL